jgi:hypothetical protein
MYFPTGLAEGISEITTIRKYKKLRMIVAPVCKRFTNRSDVNISFHVLSA